MTTRRQERIARIVKEVVSDAVVNRLNDPRLQAFVSVTRVDLASDLRNADVYLSIFEKDEAVKNKTFSAVIHARSRIQSLLARKLQSKFCPVLHFHEDEKFKKTMETMNIINQVAKEFKEKESEETSNNNKNGGLDNI
ncbi:MAG: 30S ribosome-binding factor RbfA [Planctomycetota bacterium]|jgi:ribosome-binding factor A